MIDPLTFTDQDVARARDALSQLHGDVSAFVNGQGILPAGGSPAIEDQRALPDPEDARTVFAQASFLIEIAGDQLTALVKLLTPPIETIAPWASVRALLEASALASWLLDPLLSAKDRLARSLALRYEELCEQRTCMRAAGEPQDDRIAARIDELLADADAMGYSRVTNRNGRTDGVAMRMPYMTTLVRDVLDEEVLYRLLSAFAHGHFWAVHQLAFKPARGGAAAANDYIPYEKAVNHAALMYLSLHTGKAFGTAVWYQAHYCGWHTPTLEAALDRAFDGLQASDAFRFWKKP